MAVLTASLRPTVVPLTVPLQLMVLLRRTVGHPMASLRVTTTWLLRTALHLMVLRQLLFTTMLTMEWDPLTLHQLTLSLQLPHTTATWVLRTVVMESLNLPTCLTLEI